MHPSVCDKTDSNWTAIQFGVVTFEIEFHYIYFFLNIFGHLEGGVKVDQIISCWCQNAACYLSYLISLWDNPCIVYVHVYIPYSVSPKYTPSPCP